MALGCAQPKLRGCFLQGNAFQVQALWCNIYFIIPDDRMVCHAGLHEQLALFQRLKRGIGQVGRHVTAINSSSCSAIQACFRISVFRLVKRCFFDSCLRPPRKGGFKSKCNEFFNALNRVGGPNAPSTPHCACVPPRLSANLSGQFGTGQAIEANALFCGHKNQLAV